MSNLPPPKVIRSVRKTMSLHISSQGELIVKVPFFMPENMINRFIREKEDWIFKALQKVKNSTVQPKTYQEGEKFLYLGDIYKLHIGDFKEISISSTLNVPSFMIFRARKELTNWYMREAKKLITAQVERFSTQMSTEYKSIRFSDTSSKWGSCFPDNSLQFNWRLILAPLMVINYVVIHELAHTIEKNHGRRFWNKVDQYTPAYKQHSKWLKNNRHWLAF